MIHNKRKRSNSLNWGDFVKQTQRRFKKKHGKHISSKDIKNIWDSWLEQKIIQGVLNGDEIQIDRYSTIQVVGTPIENDKRFYELLRKGKMRRRDGILVDSKLGLRKDYKYKIVYTNSIAGDKEVYFKADPRFARRVRESLNNTTTFYKIDYVGQ